MFDKNVERMIEAYKVFRDAETEALSTSAPCYEHTEVNLSDSCKWLRLLPVGGEGVTHSSMTLQEFLIFPSDFLTDYLDEVLTKSFPKVLRFRSLTVSVDGNGIHFCISGDTSLQDLQSLFEACQLADGTADKTGTE